MNLNELLVLKSNIMKFCKIFNQLNKLRITMSNNIEDISFEVNDLPLTLEHLTLTKGIHLKYNSTNTKFNLPLLKSFTCYFCTLDQNVITNFHLIFKYVRKLVLKTHQIFDVTAVLNRLEYLQWILISNENNGEPENVMKETLTNNSETNSTSTILDLNNYQTERTAIMQRTKSNNNNNAWTTQNLTSLEIKEIEYIENGQVLFWSSFFEYDVLTRFNPNETIAMKTGKYKFNGTINNIKRNRFQQIQPIPNLIQPYLKSIYISNVEIISDIIFHSLQKCENLEELILTDIKFLDRFEIDILQPSNFHTYKLTYFKIFTSFIAQNLDVYSNIGYSTI